MQTAPYAHLTLKAGKERATQKQHPWIFSGAIGHVDATAKDGDILQVQQSDGSVVGYGFYSPKTMIRCRVFEFTDTPELHIDADYWKEKLLQAWTIRQKWVLNEHTTAFRWVHAEGDFFPGIIADYYNGTVVVDLLIAGTRRLKSTLEAAFLSIEGIEHVFFKSSKHKNVEETTDQAAHLVHFKEHDLLYQADVVGGQKTGFFLDQRDSRALIRNYAKGRKVLNTFSYSGGFSLNSLAAGASLVHSVDVSERALEELAQNLKLNAETLGDQALLEHKSIKEDVFQFLGSMPQDAYDLIVLDPPAFTKHRKTVPQASRGYKELNLKAFKKLAPAGILFTYSCSQHIDAALFRKIVFSAAADAQREVRILHQINHGVDHPINLYHPENEYLKGLVLLVN